MEAVIDDGKTKDIVCHDQENNNKLDESAKTQPNKEKPGEPDGQNKEKSDGREETLQNTEKIDGPEGQIKEKPDDREETLQSKEKLDEPEGTLQNKKRPVGKQKNRKLRFRKRKKNAGNGNVDQNQINDVKSKVAHPEELKFAKPEGSSQQKQLELVRPVGDQQFKENTEEPEGTDHQGGKGENNGEVSKGDMMNKKLKKRARKGKVSAGIKMEKLKQNIGEASEGKNIEKTKDIPSLHDKGRRPDKSKDKLGGLIFMCSPKTKPDCFRYSVMGVTMAKKDLVLRIKPGLKLFLYDFDLKLMYGVYRATSSGGIKLEPAAFGGAFPVQVKFEVFKDCYPLPESVFKKAIKENYNEKRKFKTELTFEQVKKLTTLFRTVGVSSKTHTRSPAVKRDEVTKARGGFKKHRTNSSRARSERDAHAYVDDGREARKEEYPRESYMSEREYRTYGLLGRRRSRSPPRHAGSSLVPRLDLESEVHPRYPVSVYGDTTTSIRHDPLLVGRSDSRPYSLEGRRGLPSPIRHEPTMLDGRRYLTHDPISQLDYQTHLPPAVRQHSGLESNQQQYAYPRYDFSSDPYRSAIRRDELVGGPYYTLDGRRVVYLPEAADPLRRREPEVAALDLSAPFDYNQGYTYQEASRHDPVSSRYSFAGPSSYR